MKRKAILGLALLLFVFSFVQIAQAGPSNNLQEAITLANQELGWEYFTPKNVAEKPINLVEIKGLSGVIISGQGYAALAWGNPYGDIKNGQRRNIGYTKSNEDYTNPGFPHDAWAGGYLEDRNWVKWPWANKGIKAKYNVFENNKFDNDVKYLPNIQKGLAIYYADVSKGGDSSYWDNWHEYVHILVPPTQYTWGMGRMWHIDKDNKPWYISIPLTPGALLDDVVNLTVKDLKINPNPVKEGDTATVTATVFNEGEEPQTTLAWYYFNSEVVGEENITIPGKGSIPVSFNITAPIPGTYPVEILVNPNKDSPSDEINILNNDWPGDNYVYDNLIVAAEELNLVAQSITTNAEEEGRRAESGETIHITTVFKNDSASGLENVPVGLFVNNESISFSNGITHIPYMGPGEEVTLTASYKVPSKGSVYLEARINIYPLEEAYPEVYKVDNKVGMTVNIKSPPAANVGHGTVSIKAVSQDRSINRPAGTAKWTDWITVTVTPKSPDEIEDFQNEGQKLIPPKGKLLNWFITSAQVTYPKKNPGFTFGNPLPPQGTTTVNMNSGGYSANIEFKEDWAMDGAKIYNILKNQLMAENPKQYDIGVKWMIQYTYSMPDPYRVYTEYYADSANLKLLVNGTGVDSLAS